MLWKYVPDPSHVVDYEPLEIDENLSYTERPVEVLAREVKMLRNREIPLVKVLWWNHRVDEATWEREDDMSPTVFSVSASSHLCLGRLRLSRTSSAVCGSFLSLGPFSTSASLQILQSHDNHGDARLDLPPLVVSLRSSRPSLHHASFAKRHHRRVRDLMLDFPGFTTGLIGVSSPLLGWIRWAWTPSRGIAKFQVRDFLLLDLGSRLET
ncbi:pol protein [Cucumis melo var. makuwa]|uniref:Pol protein n=1 Tax=Cucumis melo var. makuwa TaxID=1194695 RepID=A0A5D3CLN5_CUCMM|nr:pol protein [Cucumis melo var. makuwa]